jgi:hypothetical protein
VVPVLLAVVGFVALVAGIGLLASFGARFRVGRLIAATPGVPIADARSLAAGERPPYVGIHGRIDSDDEFEDAAHRPLVYRRTRVQVRGDRRWKTVHETREAVPFRVADAHGEVVIDPADLDVGLVVVTRESTGQASDLPDRVPDGTPPATPVRVRIDQVSSVEHAMVLGVPSLVGSGVRMGPGRGRPLVLTTLEPDEAMRVLAEGRQPVIRVAVGLFIVGGAAIVLALVAAAALLAS